MNTKNILWHKEILPASSNEILVTLVPILPFSQFYLAGGTGLALMLGHRLSRDFDFFSPGLFNEDELIQKIQSLLDFTIVAKSEHTLHLIVKEIKLTFIGYNYPLLFQTHRYKLETGVDIEVADERDIACMKISAVSSRGTKRDFVDLYMVAQMYNLSELFALFKRKFSLTPYNNIHILKSLTYFADAELDPMPEMLVPISWDSVKQFFTSEALKLS
jgi:predicted nucleotidyltransferase component of viral defense system